jgi:hypothetical protein
MSARMQQAYASVTCFQRAHGLTWPANEAWRLTEREMGEIVGLPGSRGILTATNGILCYIEQEMDGRICTYLGHIEWFVADSGHSADSLSTGRKAKQSTQSTRIAKALMEYE